MPRRDGLPHILVPAGRTETRLYTWARPVRGTPPNLPTRDPVGHGAKLKDDLAAIRAQDDAVKRARAAVGVPADRGMVLEFESEPGFALTLSSMDRKRVGMEVLSVREKGSITLAAVLVPDGQLAALEGLLTDYQTKLRAHRPEGERWVAPVAAIRRAVVETLWTDEGPLPPADQRIAWEVWLRRSNSAMADFRTLAVAQGIEVDDDAIEFVDRIVVLARGSLQQLTASVELLDCVAELRRAKRLASFFMGLAPRDQGPWVRDLADRTERVLPDAPVVCLLDSGVNRGHPLLEPFLSPDDLHTVDDAWGTGDHRGHGTLMAGLAAWGDLCEPLAGVERVTPTHGLESVVLLPPASQPETEEKLWGAYTLRAVSTPELAAPDRERVFCMTVMADDPRDRGKPSSWSAEIDTLCEGRRDQLPRLLVVSAGSIPQADWHGIDENDTHQVYDPGQAWNAITVGAYTDKASFDLGALPGHQLIGTPGDLSPASATSVTWKSPWPNKPEVVFEGGNGTSKDGFVELPDDLRLLSTHWRPNERLLETMGDTSGATALAARFAATLMSRLRARNVNAWPETVRALMVHSARWTTRMREMLSTPPKPTERDLVLRRYGWGVPDIERASNSASNVLTLVAERSIQPFANVNPKTGGVPEVKTKDWHLFELPWPRDVLQGLGNHEVELRVTLSYYVEPNPARRGWNSKRRYQSAGLRFAMKNPTESLEEFRARVSKNEQDEEGGLPSFSEGGWLLTAAHRDRGSIHSDVWVGPAVELAERGYLAVYPVGGWWKDRLTAGRYNESMRYALVVSIETRDEDVDIYTPVSVEVAAEIEIQS